MKTKPGQLFLSTNWTHVPEIDLILSIDESKQFGTDHITLDFANKTSYFDECSVGYYLYNKDCYKKI